MAKIEFYFDEMMSRDGVKGLAAHGTLAIMAVDVEMTEKDDLTEHLAFATARNAVLVTHDRPFATRALSVANHAGLVCWTGDQDDFGGMVRQLRKFAQEYTAEQVVNRVFWLK
jgi:predicted nuclease of predicted toxin-antitoxin system